MTVRLHDFKYLYKNNNLQVYKNIKLLSQHES